MKIILCAGMLLLAAWSTNGWLPSGHAMRMALDLGLHRALEKLADDGAKLRTEDEERELGKCQRIHVLPLSMLIWGLQLCPRGSGSACTTSTTSASRPISRYC